MKREVWEELVDRVVDDECTDEERRALYEAAERNPEIREALDAALRSRELLRSSAGATVPPEFSERFRLAIERSDFWIDREVERPAVRPASTTASARVGGRRFLWATTGAAIAFAAVALLASNVGDGTRWGGVEAARLDKTKKAAKSAQTARPRRNRLRERFSFASDTPKPTKWASSITGTILPILKWGAPSCSAKRPASVTATSRRARRKWSSSRRSATL